jgi:FdhD protein
MKGPATPSSPAHRRVEIDALRDAGHAHRGDAIAVEEPLEIRLLRQGDNDTGRAVSITMRTPGNDAELALGFLHGEGILHSADDIVDVRHCGPSGNVLRVTVSADLSLDLNRLERNFYTTSSCGVCGKASIDAVTASLGMRTVSGHSSIGEAALRAMPGLLRESQAGSMPRVSCCRVMRTSGGTMPWTNWSARPCWAVSFPGATASSCCRAVPVSSCCRNR